MDSIMAALTWYWRCCGCPRQVGAKSEPAQVNLCVQINTRDELGMETCEIRGDTKGYGGIQRAGVWAIVPNLSGVKGKKALWLKRLCTRLQEIRMQKANTSTAIPSWIPPSYTESWPSQCGYLVSLISLVPPQCQPQGTWRNQWSIISELPELLLWTGQRLPKKDASHAPYSEYSCMTC